jgi:peroxiredoxin
MLEIGTLAPELAAHDTQGQAVRLADFRGRAAVLLFFMRSMSCPVCGAHVKDLVRRRDEFDAAGVRVLIAVPEGRAEAAAWKEKRGVPYPVLTGDDSATPHEAFGLHRRVFGTMQQSGSILIDAQGVLRHFQRATLPTAAYDKKGIAAALGGLRAAAGAEAEATSAA